MSINKEALVNQLISIRAAVDAALSLLANEECTHPKDKRINYSTLGGREHWECGVCGFEYIEKEEGVEHGP